MPRFYLIRITDPALGDVRYELRESEEARDAAIEQAAVRIGAICTWWRLSEAPAAETPIEDSA